MSTPKPTTKEQLIYYMVHNISLGTYDKRFLDNILASRKDGKTVVTSNQAELLNKITVRYSKQLRRKEIDVNEMVKLSWESEPIESSPEFTDAFITIKDDEVELRTPYKKDFINDMRSKTDHLNIVWHKETKKWTAPLCEDVLRRFIKCVEKHFYMIHYCPKTIEIINGLADVEDAKYWNPTLVRINSNLYIVASNANLDNALGDLQLDVSPSTIAKLVWYGVVISDDIVSEITHPDKLTEFVLSHSPIVDSNDPETVIHYLKTIDCDYAIIIESFGSFHKNIPSLLEKLKEHHIDYHYIDRKSEVNRVDVSTYNMPVLINTGLWANPAQNNLRLGTCKAVFLGNNKPIEIK